MKNKRLISIAFALVMVLSFAFGSLENTRLISKSIIANAEESFATAKNINLNQEYSNALTKETPYRYYKFSTTNNGYVTIDFGKDYSEGSIDWIVYLYNSNMEMITYNRIRQGNTKTIISPKIGVSSGTYYVEVTSDSWNNLHPPLSNYYLRISYKSASNWEKEINNEYQTVNAFSIDTPVYGTLSYGDDVDFYRINVAKSGKYILSFSKDIPESISYSIYLYNEYMEQQNRYYSTQNNTKTDTFDLNLAKGDYYIKITSSLNKSAPMATYCMKLSQNTIKVPDVSGMKAVATTAQAIKLTWNKVPNATGYVLYIYNKSSKKWERVAVTKNNMYVVTKLNHGEAYAFTARAYRTVNGKNYYSQSFKNYKTSTKPAAVSFWVNSKSRNNATISWNKVNGATSYVVYYKSSPNGAWKRIAHVNNRTTSFTKSGLPSGSTGYFTVRAYRTYEGKSYGSAFDTKSTKVK